MKNPTMNKILYKIESFSCFCGDIIFTKRCFCCGKAIDIFKKSNFCSECIKSIKPIKDKLFLDSHGNTLLSLYNYDDSIRIAIHGLKYYNNHIVGIVFAKEMAELVAENYENNHFDFVVYVPCFKLKNGRKYNQAEFLAKRIAARLNIPLGEKFLRKAFDRKSQTSFKTRRERFANVKGLYCVRSKHKKDVVDKKILLIDDVSTTGATLCECVSSLKDCGAKEVVCLTIAKTHPNGRRVSDFVKFNGGENTKVYSPVKFMPVSNMKRLYSKEIKKEKVRNRLGYFIEK